MESYAVYLVTFRLGSAPPDLYKSYHKGSDLSTIFFYSSSASARSSNTSIGAFASAMISISNIGGFLLPLTCLYCITRKPGNLLTECTKFGNYFWLFLLYFFLDKKLARCYNKISARQVRWRAAHKKKDCFSSPKCIHPCKGQNLRRGSKALPSPRPHRHKRNTSPRCTQGRGQ